MKTFLLSITTLLLLVLFSAGAAAQTDSPLIDAEFKVISALPAGLNPAGPDPVPLPDPLILQAPNGNCYAFWCAEGEDCEQCRLFWKDRNGNGQVNPKQELRCRCVGDPEKECKLKWKEVACQD